MARLGRKDRGLVERPKGSGTWWVRLYHIGREHWFGSFAIKGEARAFYEQAKREQRAERFDPERYHRRRQRSVTLKAWIEQYLERLPIQTSPWRRDYARWWTARWGEKRLHEVTVADLERLQAQLINQEQKAPSTVNRYMAFLRHLFNRAVREGVVERSPFVGIRFFKEPRGRLRFLTEGEEQRLKEVMAPEHRDLVTFALHTGLRRSEQFHLRWEHVDQENRVLTIPRSKSGETRYVQINEAALTVLKGLSSWMTSPWVFPSANSSRPIDAQNFYNRVFIPALERAGIEGVVWHTLRHTFASRLVMAGVDLRTVQELMGHKGLEMTLRYSHLSPGHLKNAVETLVRAESQQQTNSLVSNSNPSTNRA